MRKDVCREWDLREIVSAIADHYKQISEIFLFGSRGYNTGSLRSDIDLLAVTNGEQLSAGEVNSWLPYEYPPVDLFWSYDKKSAISCANGGAIICKLESADIIKQIDAIKLWEAETGFAKFDRWIQTTDIDQNFQMSVLPGSRSVSNSQIIQDALAQLEQYGIKTYYAGSSWEEIGESIVDIIETSLQKPNKFQKRAKAFSFDNILLNDEYDFQILIHLLLRPLFHDIENENVAIQIDGNLKKADFGVASNKIIIEAKYIDTTSKKAEVIKTIDGLKNFYSENPNVECLLFLVLYKKDMDLDPTVLEARFSEEYSSPPIYVRFLENPYVG